MKGLVDELLKEIVERYMKMGAGQFLRDFRRDYHLKNLWPITRPWKRISHACLLSLINELTHKGLILLYTKCNLQQLCSAYNVHCLIH